MEAYRRDASSKDQLISELKSTKKLLMSEVKDLKQELLGVQEEKQKVELEQTRLQKEVLRVREQMSNMEAHLQAIQTERDQLETQIQVDRSPSLKHISEKKIVFVAVKPEHFFPHLISLYSLIRIGCWQ